MQDHKSRRKKTVYSFDCEWLTSNIYLNFVQNQPNLEKDNIHRILKKILGHMLAQLYSFVVPFLCIYLCLTKIDD